MKNTRLTACALALAALWAAPCHAQGGSHVKLYGRFDAGLEYLHGLRAADGASKTRWAAQSGDWGASWLGLTGTEELGAGQAIVFSLEQGISLDSGTVAGASAGTGEAFSRKATIGWRSDTLGTLSLGRDILLSNNQWDMDPMMNELSSATTLMRSRNALIGNHLVQYQSPQRHGVDLLLQYGASQREERSDPLMQGQKGRIRGLQLSYATPALLLRAQWNDMASQDGKLDNLFTASRESFAGAAWKATPALTLQAGWNHLHAPDTPAGLASKADHVRLGGQYQMTRQLQLTAGLYHIQVRGGSGQPDPTHEAAGHATLFAAGGLYYFSPVSFLYLSAAQVRNGEHSNFGVGGYGAGTDNLNNPATGHAQRAVYAGLVTGF